MAAPVRIEYYEARRARGGLRRRWYWSLVAANGLTVADGSESYVTENNVQRAIEDNINSKFATRLPVFRRG